MTTTRTPGITFLADGRRFIDKRHLGVRIGLRVGTVAQEQAEERLRTEMARVESNLARKAHARPTFADCAGRHIKQSRAKRSIDVMRWHVALLQQHIGHLEPQQVHDQTLEPFINARRDAGLPSVRVHDLRHSFACRLRAAGVSAEDREVLLGHANHSMAGHYASADVGRLQEQANLILNRSGTQTLLRVADSCRGRTQTNAYVPRQEAEGPGIACHVDDSRRVARDRWISRSTAVPQSLGRPGFQGQVIELWRAW